MKRFYLLLALVAAFIFGMQAEIVPQKQAKEYAQQFFNEARGRVTAPVKLVYNGKNLTTQRLFTPFYVYNSPAGGFVIISAENKGFPILAYSLSSNFDVNNLSEAAKAVLGSYARDIEYIRYDSRVPEKAIAAWGDYPAYVSGLLRASRTSGGNILSGQYVERRLWETISDDAETEASIYTPSQWQDMIDDQLQQYGEVIMGYPRGRDIYPVGVMARQGDYYSLALPDGGDWMARLNATEYLTGQEIASIGRPIEIPENIIEEKPFAFYDDFVAETRAAEESRQAALDEILTPTNPVLKWNSGGHFTIDFPERVRLVRVYNVSGAMVKRLSYGDTRTAVVDLGDQPSGFYIATALCDDGKSYGFKLYR